MIDLRVGEIDENKRKREETGGIGGKLELFLEN